MAIQSIIGFHAGKFSSARKYITSGTTAGSSSARGLPKPHICLSYKEQHPMTPDNLARLFARLEATVPGCIHLDGGSAPYAYLRNLIAPGTYWTVMLNPAKDEQLRVLLALPPSDYVFLQPITLCCPVTHNPTEGRLLSVALLPKAKVSHEHMRAALILAPMKRSERRRVLRTIAEGYDIIMLAGDATDEQATARMLREIERAPLPV
jgi:hypothetical protein